MDRATVPVEGPEFWFSEVEGVRPKAIDAATATSLYRYARQRYECDIPTVRIIEYVMLPATNRWGDDVLATVQYRRDGAYSSAGGHLDENGRLVWRCYAD